jgi:ketosteroid isomerase-like protein
MPNRLDLAAERQDLLDTDRAWAAAAAAGDVETLTTFWAEDAVNYFPGAPVARGREEILALVKRNRSIPGFALSWTPKEAVIADSGDLGYTTGTFRVESLNPPGDTEIRTGHYVCIWKRLGNGLTRR